MKPPFGKGEGRENPSFIMPSYSPGPGHYQKPPTFDNKIVAKDAEKGVYFVLEKGSLHRKHEWLAADKSRRIGESIGASASHLEPGPGTYSPRNNEASLQPKKNNSRKEAYKGSTFISNLKNTGLNLTTVPSIPSKSQLLVIHPHDYMNQQQQQDPYRSSNVSDMHVGSFAG